MKIANKHIVVGTIVIVTGIVIYDRHRKKKKKEQKKANRLFGEIGKSVSPETIGVDSILGLDPNYANRIQQKHSGVILLHRNTVDRYAKRLDKAFIPWFFGDDDIEVIYNILGNLKDHVQLSQIVKRFQKYDEIGLKERIRLNLKTEEIEAINKKLTLLKPFRTKVGNTIEPDWNKPFDMNYTNEVIQWLGKPVQRIPVQTARKLAKKIHNAKGGFFEQDDEETVGNIFNDLKDKTQVSDLSRVFYQMYKSQDMWRYIRGFLNDWQMEEYVSKPVSKLDNYKLLTK